MGKGGRKGGPNCGSIVGEKTENWFFIFRRGRRNGARKNILNDAKRRI